jgi:iron complex outermembrane recepter protein
MNQRSSAMQSGILLLGLAVTASSLAQTAGKAASDAGLEEIIVTAQHQSEKLSDVPMSIAAFSQEKLEAQGIKSIDDLARLSPGVTFLRNGMGSSANYNDENSDVSIRGIDSTAGTSTTGIYVDDTPIQNRHLQFGTVMPYPALFDLERVEVLRGPQGTLFGAGSEGGTIRFITPEPSLTVNSGFARTEIGQLEGGGTNYEAGAAFGGPIIDGILGFRVSASWREDGGWVNRVSYTPPPVNYVNETTPFGVLPVAYYAGAPTSTGITESNANWRDTATFRAALKWAPNDRLTVSPSLSAQVLHINDTAAYWVSISNPGNGNYSNGNAGRNPSNDPWYLAATKVEWTGAAVNFFSNTSYYSRAQHSTSDYTQWIDTVFLFNEYPPAGDIGTAYFQDRQDNFTQEFRLSSTDPKAKLQWNVGLFYSHNHENTTELIYDPDLAPALGLPELPQGLSYSQPIYSVVDKQLAVFGELSMKLTDTVKFTAGARASRVDFDGFAAETGILLGGLVVNGANSGSDRPVTPRFVLNYQPDSDQLYYASAAKGFRPGGINVALPSACTAALPAPIPNTFNSDSLWQYELGLKNTLDDRKLQLSASVYYTQWKNIQQFVYLTCGLGFTPNLGDVTGKGGDIALDFRPTPNLTLGFSAAYTDTTLNNTVSLGTIGASAVNLVTKNDQLPANPWNIDLSGEYVFNEVDWRPYLRFDYQFASAQTALTPGIDANNAPNSDPTLPGIPEIKVLALRAGMRLNGFDVSLFVQNALNYHTPTFVSRDLGTTVANGYGLQSDPTPAGNFDNNYFARGMTPRTFGVTATYRY